VVAAMLVLVGAAVFLNWKYTGDEAAQETGTKILGESTLVAAEDPAASAVETDGDALEEETVYTGSDYFASARLTRQQARDSAIDLLEKAAGEEGADTGVRNEASQGIQVLASYTLTEAQIENLVIAKGYQDCVAFMGDDSISVVVSTDSGELTGEDVAKITDITKSETGYSADCIKIMAAN
jgi:stage III sporulation protein AH